MAEDILRKALRSGADLAEVFMLSARSLSAEVKSREVDALEISEDFGYSLRVIKGERLGFSYSTAPEDWQKVVDDAMESAEFTGKDPFLDIAAPAECPDVEIHDASIADITEEDAIERVRRIEDAALGRDERVKKVRKASGSFSESEVFILNSKGLAAGYRATSASAQIMVVAEDGADAQMGWGYESGRFLGDVDFEATGREAADRALRLLGARKAATGKGSVLLESSVATEFLSVLASSFSSENVQKGKSLLIGRKGERVVSEKINIVDNGLLRGAVGSRPFDAEGTPSTEKKLIQEGRLMGYLYNLYTAGKDGTVSTSNAVRHGIHGIPVVGISNLYLEGVSDEFICSLDALTARMERGLLVTEAMGIHTANPITGEFSIGVTGLWFENGKAVYPVKEAAISGNILGFFGNVAAVSDNLRFYGKIGAPDILIEDVDISG
ncbi:MAG: TldD/PmbA family protein [Nitrospirae bacterium]|nr:TldD/PmbA family protein [Nitrospirota bacterium]